MHTLPDFAAGDMGIRKRGPPYTFYWQTNKHLAEKWGVYRWQFKLRNKLKATDIGFWLNITGSPAKIDIKRIELIEWPPQQMLHKAKRQYPGPVPAIFSDNRVVHMTG